jgi:hypothetical protein
LQTEATALAQYANFFRVGHNAVEFFIDFCQQYQKVEGDDTVAVLRIIVTPDGARELHSLLASSLAQHAQLVSGDA